MPLTLVPPRDPTEPASEGDVRAATRRETAEEWALVLAAEGVAAAIRHRPGGFTVCVHVDEVAHAEEALVRWEAENEGAGLQRPALDRIGDVDRAVAAVTATALVCFFAWTGPPGSEGPWYAAGRGDAARILTGDFARTFTSLTLHADVPHVLANALFGGLFLAAASAGFGPGLALALTILAGASGNLANAIFQGPEHASIGASTAVFGAVGLLAGRALAQRLRSGSRGMRTWVPVAAGLALLAMLGTSARSDVWAHLFGFLAGVPIGTLAALALPHAPRLRVQVAIGLAGIGSLWLCWRLALA